MNKESEKEKLDLIEVRKREIELDRAEAEAEKSEQGHKEYQKMLPWYKKDLFFNILGAIATVFVIVGLTLIAYNIKFWV
ncbi:hypothetical protein [Mycoplasmopsis gallinacea]|uniref:Uncharacterized protein n=1 Tax=Mycoplasmopsis gallinacea TaxID=29556 RepID=A0A449A294_9BACT|nr:hypothetical protein [Mycoplasmopsis gallinacea]VEU58376.1 Uncharacterised protein [Mycoplasmopsis gallinacea]